MLRFVYIVAIVLGAARLALAHDVTPARVLSMLSSFEATHAPADWAALGSDAVPILVRIAKTPDELTFRRLRAISALSHFRLGISRDALEELTRNPDGAYPPSFQRAALLALAAVDEDHAMPFVEAALDAPDPLLRQVAVKVLGRSLTNRAVTLLQRHGAREPEAFIAAEVVRSLERRR